MGRGRRYREHIVPQSLQHSLLLVEQNPLFSAPADSFIPPLPSSPLLEQLLRSYGNQCCCTAGGEGRRQLFWARTPAFGPFGVSLVFENHFLDLKKMERIFNPLLSFQLDGP